MEYYIQGNPDKVDQIKDIFVKAGYTLNFNCSDRNILYFTVKGKKAIHWCGIKTTTADIIKSARESYKEIQLPKFKVGDILQDTRFSPRLSPVTVCDIDFEEESYVIRDATDRGRISFKSAHEFYDYCEEKEIKLPFEAGDLVLVRDTDSHEWKVDIFSHVTPYGDYKFVCAGDLYNQCIPFKGNKHLIGTTQKCCKQYPSICYGEAPNS